MPQIVWTARPDGYMDYCNRRWFDFTGFTQEQSFTAEWKQILHPDDLRRSEGVWLQAVETGEPYEVEYRFMDRLHGVYRWFLGRAEPVRNEQGEIVKWFGTCTDIDDQKRSEEAQRQLSEQLRQAIQEVHHRVKNNLQAVSNLLQMQVEEVVETPVGGILRESLRRIKAIALVHDLLSRDRPMGEVNVAQLLSKLAGLLTREAEKGGWPLPVLVESETFWLSTQAATALSLVVGELIDNAIKQTNAAQRKAEDAAVFLRLVPQGEWAALTVEDRGPGFGPAFDPQRSARLGLELALTLTRNDLRGEISFGDVRNASGQVCGGRVEILLPGLDIRE